MQAFKPPPAPYLVIFRANLEAPTSRVALPTDDDVAAWLEAGPIEFAFSVPIINYSPPAAGMTLGERRIQLPKDSYMVIRQEVDVIDRDAGRPEASLRAAEIAALFDLRYPGILSDKIHEGFVNEGAGVMLMLEGPLTITAQPRMNPHDVVRHVSSDLVLVRALPTTRRSRFRLASRWYRRGLDTVNEIDKFLSWWTALEVYPGEGDTDVVAKTRDLIAPLYPELTSEEVKARLGLGQIAGLRGDIVHQGIAFVRDEDEATFSARLKTLQSVVATALRLLANLPPGDELDQYLRPGTGTG